MLAAEVYQSSQMCMEKDKYKKVVRRFSLFDGGDIGRSSFFIQFDVHLNGIRCVSLVENEGKRVDLTIPIRVNFALLFSIS